jgi:Zn finger protein HypA/HybF involved in hydrogenase expression
MEKFNWKGKWEQVLKGEIQVQYSSALRRCILNNNLFEYKCNKCGIKDWNNKNITLEIEHKDGNNWNNKENNLELLCPNCHSQTLTFRKKGINIPKKQITNNEILEQLKICTNINQVLINLKLSNSGGNYKRVHKLIKLNGLDSFYDLPKIVVKPSIYKTSHKEIFEKRVNDIKGSNIDFSSSGWGVKLGRHLNLTSYAAMSWVKKNLPEFYKDCFKQKNKI